MRHAKPAIMVVVAASLATANAHGAEDVMVVFDGSNSMWGQIDGTAKIEIARDAMDKLLGNWTEGTNLGLVAYGHRREGDCTDIETVLLPSRIDPTEFLSRVREITPRGKTPLTAAVEKAAHELAWRDNPATVVLISDGIESCQRDPCALAQELERSGVDFTAHVIGFGLGSEEEQASIACIAEQTGGRFIAAGNASELGQALGQVSEAVAVAPEPEPEPEPTARPAVTVTAPDAVTAGAEFDVSWSETLNQRDIVTIVPAGADEVEIGNHLRTRDDSAGSLRAPAQPGLYAVRYLRDEGRNVAGEQTVEVIEAETSVTAPGTATAGSEIDVAWSGSIHPRDIVTIVAANAKEGTVGNHLRVREDGSGTLTVPADAGLYQIRYVLDEGRRTIASTPVEALPAETTLTTPETVVAGANFDVSWSRNIDARDLVTIVPAGIEEGSVGNHLRVRDRSADVLRAPAEPGLYELRYVLDEGRRTIASAPVEVVAAETTVTGPETGLAGSEFDVSWSRTIADRDIVTIVPAGADEGAVDNHIRVRGGSAGTLRAPGRPGLYEVRYVLDEGRRTIASATIELREPEVAISAINPVRAGGDVEVSWTGDAPSARDIVTLVPLGADEGEVKEHARVRDRTSTTLPAPDTPGIYEIRYVLDEGRRTLASATVEVVEETATLDTGGSLDVPGTASPGEEIQVMWTSSSASTRQRISLAGSTQPDFTWIEAKPTDNEPPLSFTMPNETGFYEFRLLDLAAPAVLSRAIIEVR